MRFHKAQTKSGWNGAIYSVPTLHSYFINLIKIITSVICTLLVYLPKPVRVCPLLNKQSYQRLLHRQSGPREQVLKHGANFRQVTVRRKYYVLIRPSLPDAIAMTNATVTTKAKMNMLHTIQRKPSDSFEWQHSGSLSLLFWRETPGSATSNLCLSVLDSFSLVTAP